MDPILQHMDEALVPLKHGTDVREAALGKIVDAAVSIVARTSSRMATANQVAVHKCSTWIAQTARHRKNRSSKEPDYWGDCSTTKGELRLSVDTFHGCLTMEKGAGGRRARHHFAFHLSSLSQGSRSNML